MDEEPQIGVHDADDVQAKAEFGALYDAIRILIDKEELRPWEDLPPTTQFLFTLMVGSHWKSPNAASSAFMTLVSFEYFLNSPEGEAQGALTERLGR